MKLISRIKKLFGPKKIKKAKLLTDTITPDFLYYVVEERNGMVKLGWFGRRGFWNETGWLKLKDVEFVWIDKKK